MYKMWEFIQGGVAVLLGCFIRLFVPAVIIVPGCIN